LYAIGAKIRNQAKKKHKKSAKNNPKVRFGYSYKVLIMPS